MGVDFLDLNIRLEKSFGCDISQIDWRSLRTALPNDLTAAELHEWVVCLCRDRGMKVPPSSWHRVQIAVAGVVSKPPRVVRRDTLLRRDLGFE